VICYPNRKIAYQIQQATAVDEDPISQINSFFNKLDARKRQRVGHRIDSQIQH
jgi:hypothetical protein